MSPTPHPKLFHPLTLGPYPLSHRIVLAPLSRRRASPAHVPGDLAVAYYSQRASEPGTLLIAESTDVDPRGGGSACTPGIYSAEQVGAWRRVTEAVHARGSYIFCQLRAQGRAADPSQLAKEDPTIPYVSASPLPLPNKPVPRPLTLPEIAEYPSIYAKAAANAIKAGFDGVEIHCANGYLIDQFLQDVSNRREDGYGGSVEGRARFGLEVVKAVVEVVGEGRVGVRVSPWSTFGGMGMSDPKPTFTHFVSSLRAAYPSFAYLHVIEPSVDGIFDRSPDPGQSNDFLREIWGDGVVISAGGYDRETAVERAERGGAVAFGRWFISNPDLPKRLREGLSLAGYDRKTFYTQGPEGYVDYPFVEGEVRN